MARSLLPELLERPFAQFPGFANFPNFPSALFNSELFSPSSCQLQGSRIYEEKNQLFVEVPLPGLCLQDIEVTLNKGVLFVRGQACEESQDKNRRVYLAAQRDYSYSVVLPTQIDERQAPQATYADGILTVVLNLAKPAETTKITVKAGSSSSNPGKQSGSNQNRNR